MNDTEPRTICYGDLEEIVDECKPCFKQELEWCDWLDAVLGSGMPDGVIRQAVYMAATRNSCGVPGIDAVLDKRTWKAIAVGCQIQRQDVDNRLADRWGENAEVLIRWGYLKVDRAENTFALIIPKPVYQEPIWTSLEDMPYDEYMKTEHWDKTRKAAYKRAGHRCQLCNGNGKMHCHHRTYENRGHEKPGDLIVLCEDCHAKFHDMTRQA